jgi:hypothetical protein
MRPFASVWVLSVVLAACGSIPSGPPQLPRSLHGKAIALAVDDADWGRAQAPSAIKKEGEGGISSAVVVRLTADISVYRLWSGQNKLDAKGNTNRLGSWWSADAPTGTVSSYRRDYEVCTKWNDLTWLAQCTLKKGAVVAIGPGQSVSAQTCESVDGTEFYPASTSHWQIFIYEPYRPRGDFVCPDVSADYMVDPAAIQNPNRPAQ